MDEITYSLSKSWVFMKECDFFKYLDLYLLMFLLVLKDFQKGLLLGSELFQET